MEPSEDFHPKGHRILLMAAKAIFEQVPGTIFIILIAKGMGQRGYQWIRDHCSSEKMARDYTGIYRDVMNIG